jgi:hypothetical protein
MAKGDVGNMNLSTETGELFKAFSKFQGELDNASKGKQGHGYKYADLAECINTAKPFLAKHGLAVSQMLGMSAEGKQTLITMLTHESGQYMSSEFVMVEAVLAGGSGKNPAQTLGSAITYQRRYSYAAIIGLAQEDNDAAGLVRKQENKQRATTDFDSILSKATSAMTNCDLKTLQTLWGQYSKDLKASPTHLSKLEEVKNIRKSELTEGQ